MRALAWIASRCQRRPRHVAAGGIADHAGEIADEERDLVAELLELPHLVEQHGVPEMQVGRGRVEARLDVQRLAPAQLLDQLGGDQHLLGASLQLCELGVEITHRSARPLDDERIDRTFAARVGCQPPSW